MSATLATPSNEGGNNVIKSIAALKNKLVSFIYNINQFMMSTSLIVMTN
jgi:hypothetical protein